ncbi:MAG: hypothetical protein DHS20C17_35100 [Cyclobacteriaceae bacterium]|nr:MAG: hypothetical protein DHS20C17_35100 [Cyclobacteriaceae bacterium]
MKTFFTLASLIMLSGVMLANPGDSDIKSGFIVGDPEIKSVNALAFGPEGVLFIGDSQRAEIFALDTKDEVPANEVSDISLNSVDQQIASLLGTTTDAVVIQDMVVNPISKAVYFAVHVNDGQPVLLRFDGDAFEALAITSVGFSKTGLNKAVGEDAVDRRGRPLRKWAITDLAYYDGKVMVSGLSSEEFSSTFRTISFPFDDAQNQSSLEMYHAAHGQYETHSPIKTFLPYELHGSMHLVASYTCTPLVIFPLDEMKPGKHTKGKTVAELGNRNTPLDIVSYKKEGKSYLLLANSSRALMKIDPKRIESYQDYLVEPVSENSATAGVEFIALPYVQVQQMDKLNDDKVLLLQRMTDGSLNLHTANSNRL